MDTSSIGQATLSLLDRYSRLMYDFQSDNFCNLVGPNNAHLPFFTVLALFDDRICSGKDGGSAKKSLKNTFNGYPTAIRKLRDLFQGKLLQS